MNDFNVIVVGGGSAGFAAAARAVEGGAKVALIESGKLGGECPNSACVPTKILLGAAKLLDDMRHAQAFGVEAENISFDFKRIMARKNAIVDQLTGERLRRGLDKLGISLFTGAAAFTSNEAIEVDGKMLSADKFILATGSIPFIPPIRGLAEAGYMTNKEALDLSEVPGSVAIVGGGSVGVEFATIFSRFGSKVTIIETGSRLLGREDAEIAELLKTYIQEQGIDVLTGVEPESIAVSKGRKVVRMAGTEGRGVVVDEVMIAAGRAPAVDDLRLGAAGVRYDRRGVEVDETLKTSAGNIWACGDVTGKFLYTHIAAYQGDLAGFNATVEEPDRVDYAVVPRVTYSDPEVAGVGLTEAEAYEAGFDVRIGRMPYRYLSRALVTGERRGLVKLIADGSSRRILGGQIIGAQAGELIHEVAVAVKAGMTIDGLAEVIHAYPTLAEGIEAAAVDAVQNQDFSGGEWVA